ncbi:putative regulatory protein [Arcticibacter svalbardensis MN12-7]|uniref:Putative regulatory protein n=1 Tax=Arcticibacter svalbardensis MN12-7 TaxID=1150600 RepID=R9GWT7_9SPHI|nr:RteC domain-containing protein [Arcticibacter svalbardensis]EOR96272.1 putative regulatory protein [Arcticibacter svalbardensis MN12-7]
MKTYAEQLYKNLVRRIELADDAGLQYDPVKRRECVTMIRESLTELTNKLIDYRFDDQQEEIYFFKEIKPRFVSLLLYYSYIDLIELKKPQGSTHDIRIHYEKELASIKRFYDCHSALYHYYRGNFSFLDEKLFVRGSFDLPHSFSTSKIDRDERLSTEADYTVSRILANGMLTGYLEKSIRLLENQPNDLLVSSKSKRTLRWTAKAIDLVELIYGLQLTGVFNYGKVDIKEIADTFEKLFDVKLGNYSLLFSQSIRYRKSGSIRLLKEMMENVREKLDELDAK